MKSLLLILIAFTLAACGKYPGPQGAPGISGPEGPQGEPGASPTMIQLCSKDFVPSYPNVFPEYAICVDSKLYGVYSIPGAFLTALPPGAYSSQGVGASCTFTILENCEIQN